MPFSLTPPRTRQTCVAPIPNGETDAATTTASVLDTACPLPARASLDDALADLASRHLRRTRRVVEGPQGTRMQVDGQTMLSFCNNDYLGLANDPRLAQAAMAGMTHYGIGASASALISGHSRAHDALEQDLAAFVRMPRALYFSNGYMANLGIIAALLHAGDSVFCDRLNHASLMDGARLSRARFKVYPHADVDRLDALLGACSSPRKLVVTDAVFSMDGDIAPLPQLLSLCERHEAWLLVDDAHGFGVLGDQGRGSVAHYGLTSERLIYMGTLNKALGVAGAFVAASHEIVDWLMQCARTYMFTTANPPMLACAASAALRLVEHEPWRRDRLQALTRRLREAVIPPAWRLLPSETAIQPLIIGDNQQARAVAHALSEQHIWVPAICPPTVPPGTARLRISLSANHSDDDIDSLTQALCRASHLLPDSLS